MKKFIFSLSALVLFLFVCNCSSVFAQMGGTNCVAASVPAQVITVPFSQTHSLCSNMALPTVGVGDDYNGGNTTVPSGMSTLYMNGHDWVYKFTATQTGPININVDDAGMSPTSVASLSVLLFEAAGTSMGQCIGYSYDAFTAGCFPTGMALVSNVKAGVSYYILVDSRLSSTSGNNIRRTTYTINVAYGALQTECVNLGFENANFSNWVGTSGFSLKCYTPGARHVNYLPVTLGTSTTQHRIVGVGTDYYGGFSRVFEGSHAAMLGDDTTRGSGASQLIQSFVVTPATNYYIYHYAVVFENGTLHPWDTVNSMVKLTTLDDNGDTIPGAQYLGIISASSPGFIRVGASDVYYRPWVTQMVNLTSQVGRMVTLLFTVTDCCALEHFGYAYFDSECSTVPVPVELSHFGAIQNDNTVDLYWRTQSETNSDYYIIEKSSNNLDYFLVGETKAAGNSNSTLDYSLTDIHPTSGTTYYRLTQFDRDGSSTIFSPIAVNYNGLSTVSLKVFPNPLNEDVLTVEIEAEEFYNNSLLELRDISGNILRSVLVESPQTKMEVATLSAGTYILQLVSNSKVGKEVLIVRGSK